MEKKTIFRQIFGKILLGILMLSGIAVFLSVAFYQGEIERYGLKKYILSVLPLLLIAILISFLCHLRIREYRAAYRLSALLAPIPYCIYSFFACLGDWQCLKWLPLSCFFVMLIMELILLPITYTVRSSFEIVRPESKRVLSEFSNDELYLVGRRQRIAIWLLLALTIAWVGGFIISPSIFSIIVMSIGFISMLFSHRLAKAEKKAYPELWTFAMLIPVINWICLLLLIISASKILQNKNIRLQGERGRALRDRFE